ncbi:hypothetical protein HK096_008688, partial [Nowakowskiella sp. JEL0078]
MLFLLAADEGRPCQRCVKRKIAHLCHDEIKQTPSINPFPNASVSPVSLNSFPAAMSSTSSLSDSPFPFPFSLPSAFPPLFANELTCNELSALSDFLNDYSHTGALSTPSNPLLTSFAMTPNIPTNPQLGQNFFPSQSETSPQAAATEAVDESLSTTEKFILTAADPSDATDTSYSTRLTQIIHAKFEAGLLKPYNYHTSYIKLQNWMSKHLNPASSLRVKNVLEIFRPKFRRIASELTDIDLVLVEENFERLLLEYDRLFSAMGVPACLWRRTGEIWKSNKEFAELCGVNVGHLRDGNVCIYELISEESAVNYWEKYGNIAFDPGQKAVLTSCTIMRNGGKKVD